MKRVLIIDNHSAHRDEIPRFVKRVLSPHSVTIESIPFEFLTLLNRSVIDSHDLLILSGTSHLPPVQDHEQLLRPELDIIRYTTVPTLGICYGCQLLVVANGGATGHMSRPVEHKIISIDATAQGEHELKTKKIYAYSSHKNKIEKLSPKFDVLARSPYGVEVIKHKSRPILGTVFHPEVAVAGGNASDAIGNILNSWINS